MAENEQIPSSEESGVNPNLKTIHTYTSDMADAIRTNEASVIKIALAEKEKRDEEVVYKKASGTPLTKILLALGGVVLLGVALVAFYFVFKQKSIEAPIAPADIATNAPTIISTDSTDTVDITNAQNQNDVAAAIKTEVATSGQPGSIKQIILTQTVAGKSQPIPILDLMALMGITTPSSLLRTLDDPYMLGVYTPKISTDATPAVPHLFLILEVKDYNLAYKAMLDWESNLLSDVFSLFHIDVSGDRSSLLTKEWKDITISNIDARILYDTYGNDILYYIFPDKTNLILTDSKDAIKEIGARLLTKSTKPL